MIPSCCAAYQRYKEVSVHRSGAWMALARAKTYWAEMDATAIATRGPAVGQVSAEHYFEEVLGGTRLIVA